MKPGSIRKFDWLYLGSIAVSLLGFVFNYDTIAAQTNAELAAQIKQILLNFFECQRDIFRYASRINHTNRTVEFVNSADSFDAAIVFVNALTVAETRCPVVASSSVDFA